MADVRLWVKAQERRGIRKEELHRRLLRRGWTEKEAGEILKGKRHGLSFGTIPAWFFILCFLQLLLSFLFLVGFVGVILLPTSAGLLLLWLGVRHHHVWLWRYGLALLAFLICWPLVLLLAAGVIALLLLFTPVSLGMRTIVVVISLFPMILLGELLYVRMRRRSLKTAEPAFRLLLRRAAMTQGFLLLFLLLLSLLR